MCTPSRPLPARWRHTPSLLSALCVGALWALFSPGAASAQCDTTIARSETDASGKTWVFGNYGQVIAGNPIGDPFDAGFALFVNGTAFPSSTSTRVVTAGQGVYLTWGPQTMSGLSVTREVFVPNAAGGNFIRYIESFQNSGTTPVTVPVIVATNHTLSPVGVNNTQDGDTIIETTDGWIAINDTDTVSTQKIGFVVYGSSAPLNGRPTASSTTVFTCAGSAGYQVTYNVVVSPGDTVRIMHFGMQDSTSAAGAAGNLFTIDPTNDTLEFAGVTQSERTSLINWRTGLIANDDIYTTLEDQPLTVAAPGLWNNDIRGGSNITMNAGLNVNSNGTLTFSQTSGLNNGGFTFTPNANVNGFGGRAYSYSRTASLDDPEGPISATSFSHNQATITVNITPVNDKPSFTAANPPTINEDAGAQTVNAWATFAPGGGTDEATQTATYAVTVGTPSLFSVQPAVAANGTLTYTPAPDANGTSTITVTVQDNGGTANGGVNTSDPLVRTITVSAVNDPPIITFPTPNPAAVNEDAGAQTIAGWASFSPGPANESSQTVTFDYFVITAMTTGNLAFSAGPTIAANGTLTYTPAPNTNGTATVRVNAYDSGTGTRTSSRDFVITVNAVNDAPTLTATNPPASNEDSGAQTVASWASFSPGGGTDEVTQTATYAVTVGTPSLFSVQPAVAANGTLTYTPAPDASGTSTITVTVQDSGGVANGGVNTSAPQNFTITINPINDPPSFTASNPPASNEDAGAQTVANIATAFSPGPASESTQTLLGYTVTPADASFFSVQPAINTSGTLTYTTAANRNGTTTLSVVARDNGGTANGGVDTSPPLNVTVTVNAVNDAPSFTASNPPASNEDSGAQTVASWASFSAGPADEASQTATYTLTLGATTGNLSFSVAPTVAANGTLSYTAAANTSGTAQITVSVQDSGGVANGGVNTSATQNFTITVNGINDAPSFAASNPPASNEDAGAQSVTGWVTSFNPGPADESTQTPAAYIITGVDAAFFSVQPAVNTSGTLTYTVAPNQNGSTSFSVAVQDNGGVTNGGVDTSAPQSFTITVNAVNDPPSFAASDPPAANEDAGAQTVAGWASFSAGPADEASQTATAYTVTASDPSLFSVQPAVDANGTLTYTPAPDASGAATITVTVQDNGGVANGGADTSAPQNFTITLNPVNDPPSFSAADPAASDEDAGAQTLAGWASFNAGPADEASQTATYTVTLGATTGTLAFALNPTVAANGTLTYTAAANTFGTVSITVSVQDSGGVANGGSDTSPSQSFTITVNPVNDAPVAAIDSYDTPQDTLLSIAAPGVLANDSDIESDPLSAVLVSSAASGTLTLNADGSFTYTPNPGFAGTDAFTYQASDGVDLSETRTVTLRVIAICGDGTLFGDEECDDANTASGDGCSDLCETESGWACNSGGDGCQETCGNGSLDTNEACDDANISDADGCSDNCQLEEGFDCTTLSDGTIDACTAICGDGLVLGDEACDDANTASGDGCGPSCQPEDGFVCGFDPAQADVVCQETCGNGVTDAFEACDDANLANNDGCTANCATEDGFDCVPQVGAPTVCSSVCGDGVIVASEACDDQNTSDADGCDSACAIEDGYACGGTPSACVFLAACGDGTLDPSEGCDDGNNTAADGCSDICLPEGGFICDTSSPTVCVLDSDSDGIPDSEDACPSEPAPGTTDGCPVSEDTSGGGDTSGGDTSGGDTSGSTSGDTSGGDTSGSTSGDTSGSTSGAEDTVADGSTSGGTSGSTSGSTSGTSDATSGSDAANGDADPSATAGTEEGCGCTTVRSERGGFPVGDLLLIGLGVSAAVWIRRRRAA